MRYLDTLEHQSTVCSSHPPLRNLLFYLLPDSSNSIVFKTRAIVSVVYAIGFSRPILLNLTRGAWRLTVWSVRMRTAISHGQSRSQRPRAFWSAPRHGAEILGLRFSRRMRNLVYMATRDKVDVDTFHKGIQYALEKLGK